MATTSGDLPSDVREFFGLAYNMFGIGAQQALVGHNEAMTLLNTWILSFQQDQSVTLNDLKGHMDAYIQAHS